MDSEGTRECIGNLAVVTTILQFLSGILVCRQFVANGTTGESSPMPFLTCVIASSFWLLYGRLKGDEKIVLVNIVGILLMTCYTIVFYVYSMKKIAVMRQCAASAIVLVAVLGYLRSEENYQKYFHNLGLVATIFTLLNIAAPMVKLAHVIRTKNTECLPFPLILMSLIVCTLWACYGLLISDIFLMVVNSTGMVLAILQLMLFVVYPNTPGSPLLPKHI